MFNWVFYILLERAQRAILDAAEATHYYVVDDFNHEVIAVYYDRQKAYRRMANEIYANGRDYVHVTTNA